MDGTDTPTTEDAPRSTRDVVTMTHNSFCDGYRFCREQIAAEIEAGGAPKLAAAIRRVWSQAHDRPDPGPLSETTFRHLSRSDSTAQIKTGLTILGT